MWHVSSRSGVATLRTAIHLLLVTYLLRSSYRGGDAEEKKTCNGNRWYRIAIIYALLTHLRPSVVLHARSRRKDVRQSVDPRG